MTGKPESEYDEEPPKLDKWFTNPINALEKIREENADGGFLALSASLAMYERFLIKLAQSKNRDPEEAKAELGGEDLGGIGKDKFIVFWGCFRDGLQHQFQPTFKRNGKTYLWNISNNHEEIPEVEIIDAKTFKVKVSPWGFARFVRRRYDENPAFFEDAKSHKPGTVLYTESASSAKREVVDKRQTDYQSQSIETGHFKPQVKGSNQV